MLTEFAQLLLMQLDLTIEAHNLDKFRRNFDPNTSAITFPEPMRPFVSTDVLVESYVEGTPFHLWASAHNPPETSRRRVCSEGVDAVIKMIFIDNFVHGDLHPGNIMITPDEKLAFLDAGIAIRYTEEEHEHLIDVLSAFIQYDGYSGGKLMADISGD